MLPDFKSKEEVVTFLVERDNIKDIDRLIIPLFVADITDDRETMMAVSQWYSLSGLSFFGSVRARMKDLYTYDLTLNKIAALLGHRGPLSEKHIIENVDWKNLTKMQLNVGKHKDCPEDLSLKILLNVDT